MFKERRYYGEFLTAGEGISTNILADRLARLEHADIIAKQRDPSKGSKVIYTLTKKGLALMPVMLAMIDWSQTHDSRTEVPKEFTSALHRDREELSRQLTKAVKLKDKALLQ